AGQMRLRGRAGDRFETRIATQFMRWNEEIETSGFRRSRYGTELVGGDAMVAFEAYDRGLPRKFEAFGVARPFPIVLPTIGIRNRLHGNIGERFGPAFGVVPDAPEHPVARVRN